MRVENQPISSRMALYSGIFGCFLCFLGGLGGVLLEACGS